MLSRIFGAKEEALRGGRRWLHNEKLYNLCSTRYTWQCGETKGNKMGGKCNTRKEIRRVWTFRSNKHERTDHLKYLRVDGRRKLKCIFKTWTPRLWAEVNCVRRHSRSRSSLLGIATRLRPGRPGVRTAVEARHFSLLQNVQTSSHSRVLGPFRKVKWPGSEVNPLSRSSAEIKNERIYTSAPPTYLHSVDK